MQSPKYLCLVAVVALLFVSPAHSQARLSLVERISVSPNDPFQLQVQTDRSVAPQAEIITDPERLVIDLPGAVPTSALRDQVVHRSEVERVRVSLFSRSPAVTRIVLDLKAPEWYRIRPIASGFTVSLGTQAAQPGSDSQPLIGWVSATSATPSAAAPMDPFVVRKTPQNSIQAVNGVRVQFSKGLLEIHAHNATLSEVLFQVEKHTGAEIAIPAGTEQERVEVDSGPAPATQVLADLLNGSDLNFVVVGSPADPNVLRSVILTHRTPGFSAYMPNNTPPPTASNLPENDAQGAPDSQAYTQVPEPGINPPDPPSN
jgi:AMIN domain